MHWEYLVEETPQGVSAEALENILLNLGSVGWELATSLTLPGNPAINNGADRTLLVLKRPGEKT
jgi:hypothetical protein